MGTPTDEKVLEKYESLALMWSAGSQGLRREMLLEYWRRWMVAVRQLPIAEEAKRLCIAKEAGATSAAKRGTMVEGERTKMPESWPQWRARRGISNAVVGEGPDCDMSSAMEAQRRIAHGTNKCRTQSRTRAHKGRAGRASNCRPRR